MMLYKNSKARVRSPDADGDLFNIFAEEMQRATFAHNHPSLCTLSVN